MNPEEMEAAGRAADWLDGPRVDLRSASLRVTQADVIFNFRAHDMLRKVQAFIRCQEKLDPRIGELVPCLGRYFSIKQPDVDATQERASAQP